MIGNVAERAQLPAQVEPALGLVAQADVDDHQFRHAIGEGAGRLDA